MASLKSESVDRWPVSCSQGGCRGSFASGFVTSESVGFLLDSKFDSHPAILPGRLDVDVAKLPSASHCSPDVFEFP